MRWWDSETRSTQTHGFVVVFDRGPYKGCNAMPAATWAKSIRGALEMIQDLERALGDADLFWKYNYERHGIWTDSMEKALWEKKHGPLADEVTKWD